MAELERWHFYFKCGFLPMMFGIASVVRQVFPCWYMHSVLYMSYKRTDEPERCVVMWPPVRFHDRALNHHVTSRQVVWQRLEPSWDLPLGCTTQSFIFIPCTLSTFSMSFNFIWHVLDLVLFQTGWFPCLLCYIVHKLYEQTIYSFQPSSVLAGCYTF